MQKSIRDKLVVGEGDKYKLQSLSDKFFSVSDCHGLSASVVADERVGLDLQNGEVRPRVMKRFYSQRERELPFALVWARKEAYAKYLGTGLTHELLAIETCDLEFEEYDLGDYGWPGYYLVIYPRLARNDTAAET